MWWSTLTGRLERATALDPATHAVEKAVGAVLPRGPAGQGRSARRVAV